jgi:hypothetical protein
MTIIILPCDASEYSGLLKLGSALNIAKYIGKEISCLSHTVSQQLSSQEFCLSLIETAYGTPFSRIFK